MLFLVKIDHLSIYDHIEKECKEFSDAFSLISVERQQALQKLSHYVSLKLKNGQVPQLIFICTHNSRRSHLAQLWFAVGADYFQLPQIDTYSGGTVSTAFNFRVIRGLLKMGFSVASTGAAEFNPVYQIRWKEGMEPLDMFSKKYDDNPNPKENFAAIMVCSEADQECPFVPGCEFRLALPYEDPKASDGTTGEEEKYEQSIRLIGLEMLYVTSRIELS